MIFKSDSRQKKQHWIDEARTETCYNKKKSKKDSLQTDSENLTVNLFHEFPMNKFA